MSSTPLSQAGGWRKFLKIFFCGMAMGACDLIPGISGGTIAFLLGIYPQLMQSIKSLNGHALGLLGQFKCKQFFQAIEWRFLLSLLSGILLAMAIFVQVFEWILNHETYRTYLYGSFCGLIAASTVFCFRQIQKWQSTTYGAFFMGLALTCLLTSPFSLIQAEKQLDVALPTSLVILSDQKIDNYDSQRHLLLNVSVSQTQAMLNKGIIPDIEFLDAHSESHWNSWLVFSGALAICAMFLPGISGSYVLTILGVYPLAIAALADFIRQAQKLQMDYDAFWILFNLAVGIVLGSLLFTRCFGWLLKKYPQVSLAFLTGTMLGAARCIWPFWTYQHVLLPLHLEKGVRIVPKDPFFPAIDSPLVWITLIMAFVAFGVVLFVEKWMATIQKKQITSATTAASF